MKLFRLWVSVVVVLLLLSSSILTGCGGGGGDSSAPATALTPPTGVKATSGNGRVLIVWTAVADATSYNIYWSTTTGVTPANGTKISGSANSYIQTGQTNGTTYYYVVTAVNGNGESTASDQVSATPSTAPYIIATVFSVAGGNNPWHGLQFVNVYFDSIKDTIITNATVTVNGSAMPYNSATYQYIGNVAIAAGGTVNLSVTTGSTTYTATGNQFATFPSVTSPVSGDTWQAARANTITWAASALVANAVYIVGLIDSNDNWAAGGSPYGVPLDSNSFSIPVNSVAAGSYQVMVGIMTYVAGNNNTSKIPIANAATGSGLSLIGVKSVVPITVQ